MVLRNLLLASLRQSKFFCSSVIVKCPNHKLIPTKNGTSNATVIFANSFKTSSTEHPEPVFVEDEEILDKVMKERVTDLPESLANPYEKPIRKCILCEYQITPNYKNVKLLYQFISPYTGMVYPKNITGLCEKMQKEVEKQINDAHRAGFMATYLKEVDFLKDPKLCDPEKPVRPHKYY